MTQKKLIPQLLCATFFAAFLMWFLAPEMVLAVDAIPLNDLELNGQYIGKYIEYLSHQDVIDSVIEKVDLEDAYAEKVRSGDFVSDDNIKVAFEWTDTGYRVLFEHIEGDPNAQMFDVGVNDLTTPRISKKFIPSQQRIVSLKFSPRPYWLRFRAVNRGDDPMDFLLELDKHLFEYINVYTLNQNNIQVSRAALTIPLAQRDIEYKNFVVKLSAARGETTYYMFVNSWNRQTQDSIPLRIWSRDNFIRHASDDGFYRGIFIGLFLFIFLYNIFIFFSVRDPAYIYLSLVTLCQMVLEMSVSGLGFRYLWPDHPLFVTQVLFQTTALVMGFNLLFYRSFIGTAAYTPRLDKALRYTSVFFFLCALSFFVLPPPIRGLMIAFLFVADHVYSLPVLLPTVGAIKDRNPSGWFALIGILFYYLGLLKFGLTGSDVISFGPLRYLPVKGLSFLIIMTLGLSHKMNMMKQSLTDLNVNLERRVVERTEELKQANEKLKEMDQLKTRFFTNISHEFRTPLTLITAPIESLLRGDHGKLPHSSIDLIVTIKRNADRLLKLISDLLDFSKIEAGKMAVNKTNCDIPKLLTLWVASVDSSAATKGIKTVFEDRTEGLLAWIDADLVEKAVFNLLSNAIKFNRPQGENLIEVILEIDATAFKIIVKDSGIGIPEDQLEGIFDRFSQVDASSTRQYEGTGIGLSLTKEIVMLHKGTIHVDSRVDQGSTFTITLPLVFDEDADPVGRNRDHTPSPLAVGDSKDISLVNAPATANLERIENRDEKSASNTPTILIVEDNDDMRGYLGDILSSRYRTFAAENGKAALSILDKEKVDLVLSDLMMPEMDGYELIQSIRSDNRFETLPIILLTARSQVPEKLEGFERGANDYIVKPFSAQEVLARIKNHITLKLLRDKLVRTNLNLKGQRKILTDATKAKIEAVKEFLDENYEEDISRDDLAEEAGMSPDHLGKMFKQYTGAKISDYVNTLRVEEAARQLRDTRLKVIDIAFNVGFGSLRSFNKAFRDQMGDSPSNYRKKI